MSKRTLYGANGQPLGPTPAQLQKQAIAAQLAMGQTALRMMAAMLSEIPGHRKLVQKSAIDAMRENHPGAVIRFGEDATSYTAALMTPEELDAADAEVARLAAERHETLEGMAEADAED